MRSESQARDSRWPDDKVFTVAAPDSHLIIVRLAASFANGCNKADLL